MNELEQNYLLHWGIKRRSGRYAYGSGDRPYQHDPNKKSHKVSSLTIESANNTIKNANYDEDVSNKVFKKLGADTSVLGECDKIIKDELREQAEITKLQKKLFKDLEKDSDYRSYLEAASETAEYINNWGNGTIPKMQDLGWMTFMGVYEDGQQGEINAYSMYAHEKGIHDEVKDLYKRSEDAGKVAESKCEDLMKNSLKDAGVDDESATNISRNLQWKKKINLEKGKWDEIGGNYFLYMASHALNYGQSESKSMEKAKNILGHFDKNPKNWWYLTEAIENLGMSDMSVDEMTDSDWKKLNAEVVELRESNDMWHGDMDMNELENNYLEHHGILGQKWHKRNGPPYPLGSGDHSKSEQNAGWKKSLGGGRNEELYDRKILKSERKTIKTLNKHDQARAEDKHRSDNYKRKGDKELDRYSTKSQELYDKAKKTKNERKAERLRDKAEAIIDKGSDKVNKLWDKSEQYEKYAKEHEAAVDQILKDAGDDFDISSKETKRVVNRGEVATVAIIGTYAVGAAGAVAAVASRKQEKGTLYYKAIEPKKKKEQKKTHQEEIEETIRKAHETYAKEHPGEKRQDRARQFFNFMEGYKPDKSASKTLFDIEDPDEIVDRMSSASFRKKYGVSDADYERFKKIYT